MLIELVLHHGRLGLNLRAVLGQRGAFVDSFYCSGTGEEYDAQRFGQVQVGDILASVGEKNVLEDSIETIHGLIKKAARPVTLVFQRADENEYSLESAIVDPLNRAWVKRFLRDSRLYFQDQEEWKAFCKLHEVKLALEAFPRDSAEMAKTVQIVLDLGEQFNFDGNPSQVDGTNVGEVADELIKLMLGRGVRSILEAFVASDMRKRMKAYYFRFPQLRTDAFSILAVLENPYARIYLYLFLSKHRLHYPLHFWVLQGKQRRKEYIPQMVLEWLEGGHLNRFLQSELAAFLLQHIQGHKEISFRTLGIFLSHKLLHFLPSECSLHYLDKSCERSQDSPLSTGFDIYHSPLQLHCQFRQDNHGWKLKLQSPPIWDQEWSPTGGLDVDRCVQTLLGVAEDFIEHAMQKTKRQNVVERGLLLFFTTDSKQSGQRYYCCTALRGASQCHLLTAEMTTNNATADPAASTALSEREGESRSSFSSFLSSLKSTANRSVRHLPSSVALPWPSLLSKPLPATFPSSFSLPSLPLLSSSTASAPAASRTNQASANISSSATSKPRLFLSSKSYSSVAAAAKAAAEERLACIVPLASGSALHLGEEEQCREKAEVSIAPAVDEMLGPSIEIEPLTATSPEKLHGTSRRITLHSDDDIENGLGGDNRELEDESSHNSNPAEEEKEEEEMQEQFEGKEQEESCSAADPMPPLCTALESGHAVETSAASREPPFQDACDPESDKNVASAECTLSLEGCMVASRCESLAALREAVQLRLSGSSSLRSNNVQSASLASEWQVLLELLGPRQVRTLCVAFVLEAKILVTVSAVEDLQLAVLLSSFLHEACYPLRWQHVHAPAASRRVALQLLSCPAPFFLGMLASVYAGYCQNNTGRGIEDAVVVDLTSEQAAVHIHSNGELGEALRGMEAANETDWLTERLHSVLRPRLLATRQRATFPGAGLARLESSALEEHLPALSTQRNRGLFPRHLWQLPSPPSRDEDQEAVRAVVAHCRHYIQCLLYGIRSCCYPALLPYRGDIGEETLRDWGSESPTKAGLFSLSSASSPTRLAKKDATGVDGIFGKWTKYLPEALEACVLFDEEMFVMLKSIQHFADGDSSEAVQPALWSAAFLRSVLRSQCLATYLRLQE